MSCLTFDNSETVRMWGPQVAYSYVKTETSIFDGVVNFGKEEENKVDIPYNMEILGMLETFYSIFVKKGGEYSVPVVTGDKPSNRLICFSDCYHYDGYDEGNFERYSYKYFSSHIWEHIASYYNMKLDAGIELPPKLEHKSQLFNRYSELFCLFVCENRNHCRSRSASNLEFAVEYNDLHGPFEEHIKELSHYSFACYDAIMRKIEIPKEAPKVNCCGISLEFADAVDFLEYIKVADFDDNSIREQIVKYIGKKIELCAYEELRKDSSENELIFSKLEDNQIYEDIFKLADWLILPRDFMEWLYLQYSKFWRKQYERYRRKNPVIFQKRHYLYGDAVCKLFGAKCKDF
jgi:hypothetical protein